jgi:glycine/D-amino acid oxidase-like deaminating enzyme
MPTEIVIIGGGIIGLCTALYGLESPDRPADTRVTIIESAAVAFGASGRAAGFITFDSNWFRPATVQLAALSTADWAKLVAKFNGSESFGYRAVHTKSLLVCTQDVEALDSGYYCEKSGSHRRCGDHASDEKGVLPPWHNGESDDLGPSSKAALL